MLSVFNLYLKSFKENIKKDKKYISDSSGIVYLNWQPNTWFENFIMHRIPSKQDRYRLLFCGVDGRRTSLKSYDIPKIFYSGENCQPYIEHKMCNADKKSDVYWWFDRKQKLYSDQRVNDVDLSLGFPYIEAENYLRFPLWICYIINPYSTYSDVENVVKQINTKVFLENAYGGVCINTHDSYGLRTYICNEVSEVLDIAYPGKWRHNTDDLWKYYGNDKLRYLENFKFNICAENMDAYGYCTEKLFDAFRCGCIPIYAGCQNNPEPEIINKSSIIMWNLDSDNIQNINFIKELNENEKLCKEFFGQKKLLDGTVDYIWDILYKLEMNIKNLL